MGDEVVGECGNRVLTAETLIQAVLLLSGGFGRPGERRRDGGQGHPGEISNGMSLSIFSGLRNRLRGESHLGFTYAPASENGLVVDVAAPG